MARNLAIEAEKATKEAIKIEAAKEDKPTDKEVVIYTAEQVILNNLGVLIAELRELRLKVIEGFKQVGVNFESSGEQ